MKLSWCLAISLISACAPDIKSGNTQNESAGSDSSKKILVEDLNGCYLMNIGKDSAWLQITTTGSQVTGNLVYKRFEKDSNSGTVQGNVNGEKIHLWYRFASEGQISVREIYFKILPGKIAEGYGDMEQRNDTAIFKYPSTLNYEEKHPYIKITCN